MTEEENLVSVVKLFVDRVSGFPTVTRTTLRTLLSDHPDYASLKSISDALVSLNYPNVAVKLVPSQLKDVSFPFLAHYANPDPNFIVVTREKEYAFEIFDGNKTYFETKKIFYTKWLGTVLISEKNFNSGEVDYISKRRTEKIRTLIKQSTVLFLCAIVVLVAAVAYLSVYKSSLYVFLTYTFFLVSSIIGIFLSYNLILSAQGHNNTVFQKLCNIAKNFDCNKVLTSNEASFLGITSWSNIGLFYFTSQLIMLIFAAINYNVSDTVLCIALISLVTGSIYPVYSIYFQWKSNRWCTMCLMVQAVLLVSLLVSIPLISIIQDFRIPWNGLISGTALSAFITIAYCTEVGSSKTIKDLKREVAKYKHSQPLFKAFLQSQQSIPDIPASFHSLTIGNQSATNTITVISNPICDPCKKAHHIISDIIERNYNVKFNYIIFNSKDPNELTTKVTAHWLALKENGMDYESAMSDWYSNNNKSDYEQYKVKYPVEVNEKQITEAKMHSEWIRLAGIKFTPTIFLNGKQLSDPYELEHIPSLIVS